MKKPFFLLGYKDNEYSLTNASTLVWAIVAIIFGLGVLIAWPLICIWALNVLFNIGIAYTITTWFAAAILLFTLQATIKKEK
jgi:hypothetical protein